MDADQNTPQTKEPKLPYAEPKVTKHGTVEEITGNIGTKGNDGLSGSTIA